MGAQIGTVSFGTECFSAPKPNQVTLSVLLLPGKCFSRGKAKFDNAATSCIWIQPIRI